MEPAILFLVVLMIWYFQFDDTWEIEKVNDHIQLENAESL